MYINTTYDDQIMDKYPAHELVVFDIWARCGRTGANSLNYVAHRAWETMRDIEWFKAVIRTDYNLAPDADVEIRKVEVADYDPDYWHLPTREIVFH